MADSVIQLPADSTGKMVRARSRTVGANTVYEQFYTVAPSATYYAWTGSLACAANKLFLCMLNTGAQVLNVEALYLINTNVTAVTGVGVEFDVKKITAIVGGSAITLQQADSVDAALSSFACVTTATSATEGAVLWPYFTNNDEVGATNAFPTSNIQAATNLIPDLPNVKKPTLNINEGLCVKQITSSTVGTFGILAVLTKQP